MVYRLGPRGRDIRFARSLTTASKPAETTQANHVDPTPWRIRPASMRRGGSTEPIDQRVEGRCRVVVRQAEAPREVVAGAGRDDAERDVGLRDEVDGERRHAVAADHHEAVGALRHRRLGLAPQEFEVRLTQHRHLVALGQQPLDDGRADPPIAPERRRGVHGDDEALRRLGHAAILAGTPGPAAQRVAPRRAAGVGSKHAPDETRTFRTRHRALRRPSSSSTRASSRRRSPRQRAPWPS